MLAIIRIGTSADNCGRVSCVDVYRTLDRAARRDCEQEPGTSKPRTSAIDGLDASKATPYHRATLQKPPPIGRQWWPPIVAVLIPFFLASCATPAGPAEPVLVVPAPADYASAAPWFQPEPTLHPA